jgi:hypothetical protein
LLLRVIVYPVTFGCAGTGVAQVKVTVSELVAVTAAPVGAFGKSAEVTGEDGKPSPPVFTADTV